MTGEPWLRVEGLTAGYGKRQILKNVSFSLEKGTLTGLLGGNGCGKTTLVRTVCQQIPHEGSCYLGKLRLEECSARELARHISYIPQRSGIGISLPVLDVVLMGLNPWLGLLERPSRMQREKACRALEKVGMEEQKEKDFQTLSEGQKQLVLLARTILEDTGMLMLDEPDSALDFPNRYRILTILKKMTEGQERAGLLCLHDPVLALEFCDQLLLMKDGAVQAALCPGRDSLEKMEQALSKLYGPLSLVPCADRNGDRHLVPLWERRPIPESVLREFEKSGKRHFFLTGKIGSGKTTLLGKLTVLLAEKGMLTGEKEEVAVLPGVTTWAVPGKEVLLRENGTEEAVVIGRRREDTSRAESPCGMMEMVREGFLGLGIGALDRAEESLSAWVSLDEIGYLESGCPEFQQAVRRLLDKKRVIAVLRKQDTEFLMELRSRDDVFCYDLDETCGP